MLIQRMIELLAEEHQCMLRNSHGGCDRKCEDCYLVKDDSELDEMCTEVIGILKERKPMKPIRRADDNYYCCKCGVKISGSKGSQPKHRWNFCRCCGQAVNWIV